MRRPFVTYIAVAVIVALLTVFLGLQYSWLEKASAAEREKMHRRVEQDTKRFAEDFNKEVQAAFFNFQAEPAALESGDASGLAERFDYWKQNTEFPGLIKEIDYVSNSPGKPVLRFDPENRTFVQNGDDPKLTSIIEKIRGEKRAPSILENDLALAVPIRGSEKMVETVVIRRETDLSEKPVMELPPPVGSVIVMLDEKVLKDSLVPNLAARYFQPNEFSVAINDRAGEIVYKNADIAESPDAAAPLFDLTPDNMIFFSNRNMLPRKTAHNGSVIYDQRIESRTFTAKADESEGGADETFKIEMKEGGGQRRTAVISATSGSSPWTLNVQHVAGSIDKYIDQERTKSFLIGLGIYVLLVGAILAIVISAMRSRAYAQRQIDFVSSVSHEFRTPLAVIYSAGENLADGVAKDSSQVSRYGDLIKGEGKKLSGMVEQILEFAGARSGRKKYNFGETDMAEVVRSALAECRPQIDKAGFEIETDISKQLPAVKADAESLVTAIKNLIQNAVKYSNGSRKIMVAAVNGGGSIRLTVEDQGIGIAASEQKQIFEPFYRSKDVVDAQIHGSGLGLSMVKEIAEAHGGAVTVSSELGKGSKFTIEIPVAR
ncbi:MAG: HAMP domain-containing histidine kinase [Pyrinomonadaceae bacterium]|nr:HAMP domain-containing histidine kinase [Blastocatellia bacterium]MCW5957340.1 HAMP domain-containing histidine kinase [Pyrinomonadaceae bacterium]